MSCRTECGGPSSCASLDERSTQRLLESWEFPFNAVKARSVSWEKEIAREIEALWSNQLGFPEKTASRNHRQRETDLATSERFAMREIHLGDEGGPYDGRFLFIRNKSAPFWYFCASTGPGRHYRARGIVTESSFVTTRFPSGERVVGQSLFGRIGFCR